MELRHLKHFEAVARHLNFHRAAEALHLSQSALSRSIQTLESFLDAPLFDRQRKSIQLTPYGQLVLDKGDLILQIAYLLEQEVKAMKGGRSGELRIGASPIPAVSLVGPAIGQLLQQKPMLKISCEVMNWQKMTQLLRNGKLELFVGEIQDLKMEDDLKVHPLPSDRGVFFCRTAHPILERPGLQMKSLKDYPLALPRGLPQKVMDELFEPLGIDPTKDSIIGNIEYDTFIVAKSIIKHSNAISLAPFSAIEKEIENKTLAEIQVRDRPDFHAHYGVVHLRDRTLSHSAEIAISLLLKSN